jgi:RNA polymerase sigma-70 factor (ECF subfamily)
VEKLSAVMPMRVGIRESRRAEPLDADARLLERCAQGDDGAFETLFRKYQVYAYNIGLGLLGNPEDAADVTQEAFLRVHRSMRQFRGDASFSTWLYRVVVNLCLTELRRRQRSRVNSLEEMGLDPSITLDAAPEEAPDVALVMGEEREMVQQVLLTLPEEYRAVLVLRHFQQLAYTEIADVLCVPLSTVKTHLHRARKMFKDRYQIYAQDPRTEETDGLSPGR